MFVCPECKNLLERKGLELVCTNSNCKIDSYPIVNDIPRFVQDYYAENFSFEWHRHNKTQYDSDNNSSLSHDYVERLLNFKIKDLKGLNVLEVGCGAGRFTEVIAKSDCYLETFDLSNAIEVCKNHIEKDFKNVNFSQADLYKLPFPDNYFDLIFFRGVLQHTPNPKKSVASLAIKLKKNGNLIMDCYSWKFYKFPKYLMRWFFRNTSNEDLYNWCKKYVPVLTNISNLIRMIPLIGFSISRAIPIKNFTGILELTREEIIDWNILDTFDAYSPAYDNPQTPKSIKKILLESGLNPDYVDDHIICRATKM